MHCPLTNLREEADGRLVCATLLVPSKGCRVTVRRRWAALTAEEEEDRSDKVGDFHMPWDTQVGRGGGRGRGKGHSVRQVGKKRHGWTGKVCKCFNWGFGNFSIC